MTSSAPTRISLLERLRDGADPMAWDDFFHRYWSFAFSIARQHGCSEHTAEEVVQDVMLAIFERTAVFRHDTSRGRFRDWLGGVVRNKAAVRRRRRPNVAGRAAATKPSPNAELPPTPRTFCGKRPSTTRSWRFFWTRSAPRSIPARIRRSRRLRSAGVPARRSARLTGLTPNAVYQARKNVLRRLRDLGAADGLQEPPAEMIRAAIGLRPDAAVERSVIARIERTEWKPPDAEGGRQR